MISAAALSTLSVAHLIAAYAMTMANVSETIVSGLIRLRGVNVVAIYSSVALWMVVIFANVISPCRH